MPRRAAIVAPGVVFRNGERVGHPSMRRCALLSNTEKGPVAGPFCTGDVTAPGYTLCGITPATVTARCSAIGRLQRARGLEVAGDRGAGGLQMTGDLGVGGVRDQLVVELRQCLLMALHHRRDPLAGVLLAFQCGQALALGVNNGLDPAVLSEIMKQSSGGNWSLNVYNPYPGVMDNVPASRGYQGGFLVDLMNKDLGLAMQTAESSGSSVMPAEN